MPKVYAEGIVELNNNYLATTTIKLFHSLQLDYLSE
jgi:hypothetical protein